MSLAEYFFVSYIVLTYYDECSYISLQHAELGVAPSVCLSLSLCVCVFVCLSLSFSLSPSLSLQFYMP